MNVKQGAQSITSPTNFSSTAATPCRRTTADYLEFATTRSQRPYWNHRHHLHQPNCERHRLSRAGAFTSTNPDILFSTPDDPDDFVQSADLLAVAARGPAGILRPGQSGQLSVTVLSNDTIDRDSIPISVDQDKPGQTIDWAAKKADLQPQTFRPLLGTSCLQNLTGTLGTTTDSYNAALAQAATYLGGLGYTAAQVSDVSRLWSFLVAQANDAFPTPTLSSAVDAALPSPGALSLAIDRSFVSSIAGRFAQGIFGLGWTTLWQTSLSVDALGNVAIESAGALGFFPIQANGDYLDTDGEFGSLTKSAGIYTLTSTSGIQYVFLSERPFEFQAGPQRQPHYSRLQRPKRAGHVDLLQPFRSIRNG